MQGPLYGPTPHSRRHPAEIDARPCSRYAEAPRPTPSQQRSFQPTPVRTVQPSPEPAHLRWLDDTQGAGRRPPRPRHVKKPVVAQGRATDDSWVRHCSSQIQLMHVLPAHPLQSGPDRTIVRHREAEGPSCATDRPPKSNHGLPGAPPHAVDVTPSTLLNQLYSRVPRDSGVARRTQAQPGQSQLNNGQ